MVDAIQDIKSTIIYTKQYKKEEVVKLLGVTIRTLQRYIQSGDIAITPLRKGYSIQGKAILSFLRVRKEEEAIRQKRQELREKNKLLTH